MFKPAVRAIIKIGKSTKTTKRYQILIQLFFMSPRLSPRDSRPQSLRSFWPVVGIESSGHCRISYREGLGMGPSIMGLTTQDPYILKEHTDLYKILKFRVNWANIKQNTAVQKLQNLVTNVWIAGHLSGIRNPYISLQILKFLNGRILFNIGPISTKLKDFVKLGVLFLNIWVLRC